MPGENQENQGTDLSKIALVQSGLEANFSGIINNLSADKKSELFEIIGQLAKQLAAQSDEIDKLRNEVKLQEELAGHDKLTGLKNRRRFDEAIGESIYKAYRGGTFTLILLDIDNFKQFNSSFGHTGGDKALKEVSQAVLSSVRLNDQVFRYGGEEIAIIVESELEAGIKVAERTRQALGKIDDPAKVTACLGVFEFSRNLDINNAPIDFEILQSEVSRIIQQSDKALAFAKQQPGKNTTCFIDKTDQERIVNNQIR